MANAFTSLADALGEQLAFLERHPTPANLVVRGLLGALLHVLLAYIRAPRPAIALSPRRPLRDWHPFPRDEDAETLPQLRRWRRLRAFIGWILRGRPNRGLTAARRSRVPARPARTARAPPPLPPAPAPKTPPHPPESSDSDGADARLLSNLRNPPGPRPLPPSREISYSSTQSRRSRT